MSGQGGGKEGARRAVAMSVGAMSGQGGGKEGGGNKCHRKASLEDSRRVKWCEMSDEFEDSRRINLCEMRDELEDSRRVKWPVKCLTNAITRDQRSKDRMPRVGLAV
jgi:hypothetical protein